jgi:hypothetical protein
LYIYYYKNLKIKLMESSQKSNKELISMKKTGEVSDIGSCDPHPTSEPSPLDYPSYRLTINDTEFMITPTNTGDLKALIVDK